MVIAIPAPLVVQGDDEEVGVFEICQGFLSGSGCIKQNCITKGTTHAVKDRCAQQESLDTFGLPLQDFFNQIENGQRDWLKASFWQAP